MIQFVHADTWFILISYIILIGYFVYETRRAYNLLRQACVEYQVADRRWRWQFRYRGSRRESAVAQLFSLPSIHRGTPCKET